MEIFYFLFGVVIGVISTISILAITANAYLNNEFNKALKRHYNKKGE